MTSDFATRWTKRLVRKKDPFYMQVDYYAPHTSTGRDTRCASGPVPEPEDEHRFDLGAVADAAELQRGRRLRQAARIQRAPAADQPTIGSRSSAATAARSSPSTASTAASAGSTTDR